jgi:hypothetical protein
MSSTQTTCAIRCGAESCICIVLTVSDKKSAAGDEIGISKTIDESISSADAIIIALSIGLLSIEFTSGLRLERDKAV